MRYYDSLVKISATRKSTVLRLAQLSDKRKR